MGTVSFMGLKLSQSELAGTVIEPLLRGLVTSFTGVRTDFGTTSALPSLVGNTKNAQQVRKDAALGALRQVITAVTQGQQTISAGGAQLQVARTQLLATESSALAAGFEVLPNGVVRVSTAQRAYCKAHWTHGGRELLHALTGWAAQYTAQMRGTLTQASTVDAQIATALVSVATQYLTSLFEEKPDKAATLPTPTIPPVQTPPAGTPSVPGNPPTGTGTIPLPAGGAVATGTDTALAGVGSLGGAGALGSGAAGSHLGGAGLGTAGLGGSGLGGAGLGGAVAMAGTAGVGTGATAGAGRGFSGAGMMPMGAGAHGGAGQASGDRTTEDWLVEDGESWHPGDAPEGVIA